MTTHDVAQAALIAVARPTFAALGEPLSLVQFESSYPTDNLKLNRVAIWMNGGTSQSKGLGTASQWRTPRFRVDVFAGAIDWAETMVQALRAAWIADMNFTPSANVIGQGYLRWTGGVKYIAFNEPRATSFEKTLAQFRRIFEVMVDIGD